MRKIYAGEKLQEVYFDEKLGGFVSPTIWEVRGGESRKITITMAAMGMSERQLRQIGWCGVDEYVPDSPEWLATRRYFRRHSVKEVLMGDNPSVHPIGVRIDDCCSVIVDLKVDRNLRIGKELYLDFYGFSAVFPDIEFNVIVWNDEGYPIEEYTIECPWADDIIITEHQNNGKSLARWPVKEVTRVVNTKATKAKMQELRNLQRSRL